MRKKPPDMSEVPQLHKVTFIDTQNMFRQENAEKTKNQIPCIYSFVIPPAQTSLKNAGCHTIFSRQTRYFLQKLKKADKAFYINPVWIQNALKRLYLTKDKLNVMNSTKVPN